MILSSVIAAVSIDCAKVVSFASGLNMNAVQPARMNIISTDCCSADIGVSCDGNGRVTVINWSGLGLTGSMNSSAIPSSLIEIYLSSNQISGNIPTTFPNALQNLMLDNNLLTGSIPPLPSDLFYLYVHGNLLTGTIPDPLPSWLSYFWVQNNQLSGKMPNPMPLYIIDFKVNNNRFSGDLPPLHSAQWLEISYSLSDENKFTGVLIVDRPSEIFMVGCYVTDVVIIDPLQLTQGCDLSYNPLKGRVGQLTMCTKTGIYSANLLPQTIGVSTSRKATSATTTTMLISKQSTLSSISSFGPSSHTTLFTSPMMSTLFTSSSSIQEVEVQSTLDLQMVTTNLNVVHSCNCLTNIAEAVTQSITAQFRITSSLPSTSNPILNVVHKITSTKAIYDIGKGEYETMLPLAINASGLTTGLMVLRAVSNFLVLSVILNKLNTRRILKQTSPRPQSVHFSTFDQ